MSRGEVVSVHVSHKFSGTVGAARAAAKEVAPEEISVVDSGSASMGLGLCVLAAARAAQAGASRAECAAAAESVAGRLRIGVAFETLEYLRRGGRIGRATAFVGGLLHLKPILTVKDGEAFPVTRVRSRAKAIGELLALATRHEPEEIAVMHTTTPEDAEALAEQVRVARPGVPLHVGRFGPVLGVHGGPGMLGLAVVEAGA
jgi:DegV family protein with EDD domain